MNAIRARVDVARTEDDAASSLGPSASQIGGSVLGGDIFDDVVMIDWDGLDPNEMLEGDTPVSVFALLSSGGTGLTPQQADSLL